jgi:electron transport complex protein RnfB
VNLSVLTARLDALLPQTQCTRCGYDGCRPYAEAMASGDAAPNRCPPGGRATIAELAQALGVPPPMPDETVWPTLAAVDADAALVPTVAVIDEARCIGCYKCVLACPVDAIVGAPKFLHVVLADACSGCDLCLPPCPVDCITMIARPADVPTPLAQGPRWREHFDARRARLTRDKEQRDEARRRRRAATIKEQAQGYDIAGAIARARARRTQTP